MKTKSSRAFSLIELLLAMTVLALLMMLLFNITTAARETIRQSDSRVDAEAQARMVFQRMGLDLNAAIRRSDTDFLVEDAGSDAVLKFLTRVSSSGTPTGGNRTISLVSYSMGNSSINSGRTSLLRAAKAVGWDDHDIDGDENGDIMGTNASGWPLSFDSTSFPIQILPTDFEILAEGVIRVVIGFQLSPDNKAIKLMDGTMIPHSLGQVVYSPPIREFSVSPSRDYIDLPRINSIIVGLVTMDVRSVKLLSKGQIDEIADDFVLPSEGQLPLVIWTPVVEALAREQSNLPGSAKKTLRVYQRAYPLAVFNSSTGK